MPLLNEGTFAEQGWKINTLLNAVTVTTSGPWQPVFLFQPLSVTIEGDFVGSVQLYGSNYPKRTATAGVLGPTDADGNHPTLLGVPVTGPQLISLPMAINWIKAVVTFSGGGTCWAYASVG